MKKLAFMGACAGLFLVFVGIFTTEQPTVKTQQATAPIVQQQTSIASVQSTEATTATNAIPVQLGEQRESTQLSNDNYYLNSSGNTVHSPAYTNDGAVPAGASAQCRDGTYSFSQHRRGTCSHHDGVARWLY